MTTAEQWEERYQRPGYWAGMEPAAFLAEALPFAPRPPRRVGAETRHGGGGRALDLAMGEGRNAIFLAAQGWRVVGIDRSAAALAKAEALARERGVVTFRGQLERDAPGEAGLVLIEADLEGYRLPVVAFDLVICFNYLQRSLFSSIERALHPGGILVYQSYTVDQLDYPEGPRAPEYLLRRDELRGAFPGLETLFYAESNTGKGIATLLARKPEGS